jgi:predicted MFS family arabinose efflux permease
MTDLSYWQVLGLPQVSELLLGASLARLAGRMFSLAVILCALDRFGSPLLAGWIAFAAIGPGLIASQFAGALLDRLQAPRAITLDMLVSAILLLALIFADRTGLLGAPLWIAIVSVYSLTTPLSASGIRVLIPRLVSDEALERANALDTSSYALIEIIGPALAGALVGFTGPDTTLLIIAALYAFAAVSMIPILRQARSRTALSSSSTTFMADVTGGLSYVARHPSLRALALSYSLYMTTWGILLVVVPIVISHAIGSVEKADLIVGLTWAAAGVAGALGAMLAGRLSGRERQIIGLGIAATAAVIYPFSTVFGLYGFIVGIVIVGFLSGPVDVALLTLRQRRTEPEWLGRVLTVSMGLNLSGIPIGSAVGGWLVTHSSNGALIVAAIVSVMSAAMAFLMIPPPLAD